MKVQTPDIVKRFSPGKMLVPILIGLLAASYLLYKNFDPKAFDTISWTWYSTWWILGALFMLFLRDFAYMLRIRTLTANHLGWKQSFEVIMLWEFASALVPPSLGGGFAFAIYIINKEGIELGKSIAVILFSSFLDGIFLAIMALIAYFFAGRVELFETLNIQVPSWMRGIVNVQSIELTFWIIYSIVLVYKLFVAYALFIDAKSIKRLLVAVFSLPFLNKWKEGAANTGEEMIIASKELKGKSFGYWMSSLGSTFLSWTARFLIINFIIAAFSPNTFSHFVLYSKQVIIGVLNIGSPTPGGTGTAEFMFAEFFKKELLNNAGLAAALAVLWRLLSYYPYLFVGAVVLPRWIKRNF